MPELPEVETTRRSLLPGLKGRTITQVELKRADLRIPFPKDLAKRLTGRSITDIRRRAKYLLFVLDNGDSMLAHLGMSGSFLLTAKKHTLRTHDHLLIALDNGHMLVFHDPRRFGLIDVIKKGGESSNAFLAHLGPEPLDKSFSSAYLKKALEKRKGPIKPTLMDQRLVVGVGNIYASESLFLCGIHPTTPAHETLQHADAMIAAIRKSLNAALKSGGSTLRDFTHGEGVTGYFQHHFNVYEREGEPCVACGTEIEMITQAGRSTYFCPHCQKRSRDKSGKQKKLRGEKAKN